MLGNELGRLVNVKLVKIDSESQILSLYIIKDPPASGRESINENHIIRKLLTDVDNYALDLKSYAISVPRVPHNPNQVW